MQYWHLFLCSSDAYISMLVWTWYYSLFIYQLQGAALDMLDHIKTWYVTNTVTYMSGKEKLIYSTRCH